MAAPPRVTGTPWPRVERLTAPAVALWRPSVDDADELFALQADPALWVDVPPDWRVASVDGQRDDLATMADHWVEHGFGYWLVRTSADDHGGAVLLGIAGLRWLWWGDGWALNVLVRFAVEAQGQGLATAVLGHALARVGAGLATPVDAVVRTRPSNDRMAALAHRLGFVDAGTEQREAGTYRLLQRPVGGADAGA